MHSGRVAEGEGGRRGLLLCKGVCGEGVDGAALPYGVSNLKNRTTSWGTPFWGGGGLLVAVRVMNTTRPPTKEEGRPRRSAVGGPPLPHPPVVGELRATLLRTRSGSRRRLD